MERQSEPVPHAVPAPQWQPQSWLGAATLESVTEANEEVIALLRAQCAADAGRSPLTREISGLLATLDVASLRRLAAGTVLLVDAGFADSVCWSGAITGAVHDREQPVPFFTVEGSVGLMRLVMTQAWHLARSQPAAARLLMGISPANLTVIGDCTLNRLMALAHSRSHWLRPRWENRPRVWSDLLRMASQGEGAIERLRVRSLQLLAADARQY